MLVQCRLWHWCLYYTSNLHMWRNVVRLCHGLERGGNLAALFSLVARVTEVAGSSNRLLRDHIKCIILSQRETSWYIEFFSGNLEPNRKEWIDEWNVLVLGRGVYWFERKEKKLCGLTSERQDVPHLCMLQSVRYSYKRSGQLNFSQRLNSHIKY
jgi:hypothetical protein